MKKVIKPGKTSPDKTKSPLLWEKLITPRQELVLRLLITVWFILFGSFCIWWFQSYHIISRSGILLTSLVLSFELLLPGYFFYFILRMKRVNSRLSLPPNWRVGMVVTKAPSDPWDMVEVTLKAMLAQSYPHDTWLADEDPTPETILWCQSHGVLISCRKGIEDYHRPNWPRRTKCKEGNLCYFYDTVGYQSYDFVAQLDADHVPTPGYLEVMLRPFLDPRVGYVAAPSICDANATESWAARSRLFAEATLHGALQSGYNQGWAPLCIGSHYAVRTQALWEIGGLGPELAEDHSTTLMMNAQDWQGVFQIEAIAHGDGPASFVDCMIQEFQWSRSLMKVCLEMTFRYWRNLKPHLRFQFLFAQLWYLLFGLSGIFGFFLPILALILDRPWVRVNYLVFLLYSLIVTLATLLPVLWLKHCRCLRPENALLLSWEVIFFTIARSPWILAGVIQGIFSWLFKKEFMFKVTPKGNHITRPLPLKFIMPYFFLGMVSTLAVLGLNRVSHAPGYYFLTLINAGFYITTLVAIIVLHLKENPRYYRHYIGHYFITFLAVGSFVVACGLRLPTGIQTITSDSLLTSFSPRNSLVSQHHLNSLEQSYPIFGVYDPPGDFAHFPEVKIDHYFVTWRLDNADELRAALAKAKQNQRLPLITLEPWPWNWQGMNNETLLTDITTGKYDPTIKRILQVLKQASPQPILLRFAHEMEMVGQYPWSKTDAQSYIAAYRHVVDLARELPMNNLFWVWSPAGNPEAKAYWPGANYVDYVGISIYATPEWTWEMASPGKNLSLADLISMKYWVAEEYQKPMILTEVGVNAPSLTKQQWLKESVTAFTKFPAIKAWVYFNQVQPNIVPLEIGQPHWELNSGEITHLMRAWRGKIQSERTSK